jgi:hypothetical protein
MALLKCRRIRNNFIGRVCGWTLRPQLRTWAYGCLEIWLSSGQFGGHLQDRHSAAGASCWAVVRASLRCDGGIRMRNVIITLMVACALCFSSAAKAQVNYDLFPGYGEKQGYPPAVHYRAWVISYRDNRYYRCVASYDTSTPTTPSLVCTLDGAFDPPLLSGASVKTLQALGGPGGGPGSDEALSRFFWQIDQATGQIQFCIPISGRNCVAFQIP